MENGKRKGCKNFIWFSDFPKYSLLKYFVQRKMEKEKEKVVRIFITFLNFQKI